MDAHMPPWPPDRPVRVVLFDRDGTLVDDLPYNGDPDRVTLRPSARPAIERLRALGARVGVITNQSGVGRGLLEPSQVERVNQRIGDLLGGLDAVAVCPHAPADGCRCRKPQPGLIHDVCSTLGVTAGDCCVIGDRPSDMEAASRAGASGVLARTDAELRSAVELVARWV
jgi:histidinol-phosphate phosphatase family protein